jgi:(p)ppGpp synthase/HD superfamily hydrolase
MGREGASVHGQDRQELCLVLATGKEAWTLQWRIDAAFLHDVPMATTETRQTLEDFDTQVGQHVNGGLGGACGLT